MSWNFILCGTRFLMNMNEMWNIGQKIMLSYVSMFSVDMYGPLPWINKILQRQRMLYSKSLMTWENQKSSKATKIINSFKKELSPYYFPEIMLIASKANETNKNAIVERAIRTLKNDLIKYLYVQEFPKISEEFVGEQYYEFDTTTEVLQKICTLRNNTIHRTIRQKPIDVFYGRALNRQIIARKKYPQFNKGDLVMVKPLRARGELGFKTFHFDYDIYIILLKDGDKYKLTSLYNFIREKNVVKRRWYKPYEIRKITPQQALEHLKSPLVWEYLYHVYENPDAIEDMRKYLQRLL
jgi:hypothetical protein